MLLLLNSIIQSDRFNEALSSPEMLSHVHQFNLAANDASKPNAELTPPNRSIPKPVAPNDWRIANTLPAATAPILDCHAAANDPAAIPPRPKPIRGNAAIPKIPQPTVLPIIIPLNIFKFPSQTSGLSHTGHLVNNIVEQHVEVKLSIIKNRFR